MSAWNDEYYDIIDFYYWEPQHIGRKVNDKSKYKNISDVLSHLRSIEVPLNHQFNIFFRLSPQDFIGQLLTKCFNKPPNDNYVFHGNNELAEYIQNEATQPDILLSGNATNFAIELKTTTKSSLEQVAKYLLLHKLNQNHHNKNKQFYLLYLTPYKFSNIWQGIQSKDNLVSSFKNHDFASLKEKFGFVSNADWASAMESIDKLNITSITYNSIYNLLQEYKSSIDITSKYSDVATTLFTGIISELESRGYNNA